MKVEGPLSPKPGAVRRRASTSGAGQVDSFADVLGAEDTSSSLPTTGTQGTGGPSAPPGVSALLALQGTPATEGGDAATARAKARAEDLLRKLDQLRVDLLMGSIPRHHLIGLAQSTKTLRDQIFDPRLRDVLDEIDLRAQVELAKYDPYR